MMIIGSSQEVVRKVKCNTLLYKDRSPILYEAFLMSLHSSPTGGGADGWSWSSDPRREQLSVDADQQANEQLEF